MPEIYSDQQKLDLYQQVMKDAGLCVHAMALPQIRAIAALRSGRIDGVFAAKNDLPDMAKVAMVSGEVLLGSIAGYLVVRDGPIESISDLSTEVLGVPLGATWCVGIVEGYTNIVKVPRGTAMLQEMLAEGRIDAMLADAYSLGLTGGVADGYKAIQVDHFDVHSWLKVEFADLRPKFDQGTSAYMALVNR
ncbi:hypothetical protein UF64_15605 [Thalassospira sp. HJ]|nr:hypothetical protein UF64_15605 [Thalassospira sp. HJ]